MTIHTLSRRVLVRQPIERVFDFFSRAENLEAITPPWLRFRVVTPAPIVMREGTLIEYALRLHGVPIRWLTRIQEWRPPNHFVDVQLRGPYLLWEHTHTFTSRDGGTEMADTVRYALPFGPLGRLARVILVSRDLRSIFDYREREINQRIGL
jgi:ligand-binding SRPBCC domain-containing protein